MSILPPASVTQRETERQSAWEDRRLARADQDDPNETPDEFWATFEARETALNEMLAQAEELTVDERRVYFDTCVTAAVLSLETTVANAALFLAPFDRRKSQRAIDRVKQSVAETRGRLVPKKKFTFTKRIGISKQRDTSSAAEDQRKLASARALTNAEDLSTQPGAHGIHNAHVYISSTHIHVRPHAATTTAVAADDSHENNNQNTTYSTVQSLAPLSDLSLSDIHASTVSIPLATSSIRCANLTHCTVLCGPSRGPIFIHNCHHTTFVVACQQLRMHESTSCAIHLHVVARGIIEDSSQITVAPYSLHYPLLNDHYKETELDRTNNHWDSLDDFNWIRQSHSPNWAKMTASDQQKEFHIEMYNE